MEARTSFPKIGLGLLLIASCANVEDALQAQDETPACDAHDLAFLAVMQDRTGGLGRVPLQLAMPVASGIQLVETGWNKPPEDWSADLVGSQSDMDAVSLGLDWLALRPVADAGGFVTHWEPGVPTLGFACLFFSVDGDVHAYGWGSQLQLLFPSTASNFKEKVGLLHPAAGFDGSPGGILEGLDYNGGFYEPWLSDMECFVPPGGRPDPREITLFYSTPGAQLFTSMAVKTPVGWDWTPGSPVELQHQDGSPVIGATHADITSFAYDRTNGIVMYSLAQGDFPFEVAQVTQEILSGDVVKTLVITLPQPLLDHDGNILGAQFGSDRPTGSCGADPRFLGR